MGNLHDKLSKFMTIPAEFFSEWAMFQTSVVGKIKTRILCSKNFDRKSCSL